MNLHTHTQHIHCTAELQNLQHEFGEQQKRLMGATLPAQAHPAAPQHSLTVTAYAAHAAHNVRGDHRTITSHHIIYHITLRHITSHHIASHHIASHHITSHDNTSHHITSHRITSHDMTTHHLTSHTAHPPPTERMICAGIIANTSAATAAPVALPVHSAVSAPNSSVAATPNLQAFGYTYVRVCDSIATRGAYSDMHMTAYVNAYGQPPPTAATEPYGHEHADVVQRHLHACRITELETAFTEQHSFCPKDTEQVMRLYKSTERTTSIRRQRYPARAHPRPSKNAPNPTK